MKKTLAMLFAFALVISMCLVSGAVELDVAETAADYAAEAELASVTVAPGINVLTGDTSLATFDTMPEAVIGVNGGIEKNEIVDDGEGNNLLKWTTVAISGTGYPQMYINLPAEIGRKYYYKFDTKMTGINASEKYCWLMYDSGNILENAYNSEYQKAMGDGSWVTMEGTTDVATMATTQIGLQTKILSTTASDPCCYYYDNMAIIPMYTITYAGVGTDYILFDENGDVLTSFAPRMDMVPEWTENDGQLVKFVGWSQMPDSTVPEESIDLFGSDITLYPVWETIPCLSSTWYTSGAEGNTFTITAAENVTWTVDVGYSEATYETTDTSLTIKSAGYPGVVTVTAISDAHEDFVATKVIDLVGGSKYKPGINMMTGTPEPLTFNDKPAGALSGTPAQYNMYFSGVNGASIEADALPSYKGGDGNSLRLLINKVTSAGYPKIILKTPTEDGRKYKISARVATEQGSQFLWLDGNGNYSFGGTLNNTVTTKEWASVSKHLSVSKKDNFFWQFKSSTTQELYISMDDIAVYPYYKVTYIGLDGEVTFSEYVLEDVSGALLTEYALDITKVPGANKMSLTADGSEEVNGKVVLAYEDIVIYGIKTDDIVFEVNGEQKTVTAAEESYTIGTPDDLGFEGVSNFLVWVDQAGDRYYAGDVIASADMIGKTFTAFCQDASKPAVGYSFEGDQLATNAAKYNYQEVMEDDGRSVLHAHEYGSLWNGSGYSTDPRLYLPVGESIAFDANEYNIVQYVAKMENGLRAVSAHAGTSPDKMPADGVGVQENTQTIIFYYPEAGGNSYWQNYGECRVGGAHDQNPMDGVYRTIEVDMSNPANGNTNGGEWKNRNIYGFAIDANKWATFGGDVYVDYIRVYRDGVFSVTYNTNAPAGATVVSEVPADEGRGVGTGYLLKGEKPVVEGYTFVGWATKADATKADVVEAIDLTGDAEVYAVWQKTEDIKNPENVGSELATNGEDEGIRFKTSFTAADKAVVDEIGFIGTLETLLPIVESVPDYSALTFGLKSKLVGQKDAEAAKLYVSGVAYNKADGIDIIKEENANGLVYSAFCKGIPADKGDEIIVVRPYVQMNINGNALTFYGEAMTSTVNELK